MNAFEQLIKGMLEAEGYWVRSSYKVNLSKDDKKAIDRPSAPRWEIDLVAYKGSTNEVLLVECKSYPDSGVLDSQEFMRGIMSPVAATTLTYLLDQGWPQQMVLHLLVRTIEIYEEQNVDGKTVAVMVDRLENTPTLPGKLEEFQAAMETLRDCEIDLKSGTLSNASWSPTLGKEVLNDLRGLAAAKTADLLIVPVDQDGKQTTSTPTGYQLMKEQKGTRLELKNRPESRAACTGVPFQRPQPDGKSVRAFTTHAGVFLTGDKELTQSKGTSAAAQMSQANLKSYALFTLRSPEAILYYLGEIARREERGMGPVRFKFQPQARLSLTGDDGAVLFEVKEKSPTADDALSVNYRGSTYAISSSSSDRSMHTLSLLNQILMLQNKGTEAPGTTNVRILQ